MVAGALAGFYGGWIDTAINLYLGNAFLRQFFAKHRALEEAPTRRLRWPNVG